MRRALILLLAQLLLSKALCEETHGDLRKVLANRPYGGSEPTADLRSEKMSDAAISTQDAIFKAVTRGSISKATAVGARMATGAASAGVSHADMHSMDLGTRHLLTYGGGNVGSRPENTDLRAEKMSDAALGTQDAILGAVNRGSVNKATAVGAKMTAAAARADVSHASMHSVGARRALLIGRKGGTMREGRPEASLIRQEKTSDAALSTQEAIFKATTRGSISGATALGAKMTAAATNPLVNHDEQESMERAAANSGTRRLLMR